MVPFSREDTYYTIVQMIADTLSKDVNGATPETTFQALNIDTLDQVELIMEIEDQFQCLIDDSKVEDMQTIGEFAEYVHSLRKK
jgi:acyl carrier protein